MTVVTGPSCLLLPLPPPPITPPTPHHATLHHTTAPQHPPAQPTATTAPYSRFLPWPFLTHPKQLTLDANGCPEVLSLSASPQACPRGASQRQLRYTRMTSWCIPAAPRLQTDAQEVRCARMVWLLSATRCVREAPRPRPSRCHPHLPTTLRCPLLGHSHHPALALFLSLSLSLAFSLHWLARSRLPFPFALTCVAASHSVFTLLPRGGSGESHTVCLRPTNHSSTPTSLASALIATATNLEEFMAQIRTFAN